ncbi:unnamed protein product [Anisakis simplex]|uniref:Uncharacterized protein n=1 Tax=Anisakis simplex TaxID=6269 RepID=A0A0M3KAV9_ANISI|nr:unnamed protein product [Anisakis simplex]
MSSFESSMGWRDVTSIVWIGVDFIIDDCTEKCDMKRRYPLIGLRNKDETKYFLDVGPNIEIPGICHAQYSFTSSPQLMVSG